MTVMEVVSKRAQNSARTRDKLVEAAVELYGDRSIDAVSLREIGARAGQRNPNVLQYHFGSREGLLQAIVDNHAARIATLRERYYQRAAANEWPAAEAAARVFAMPVIEYVEQSPEGLNFVRIVSQIRALTPVDGYDSDMIDFPRPAGLATVFDRALSAVGPREAQRRVYLVVNTTFHAIAEIYRGDAPGRSTTAQRARGAMVEQLICMLSAFLAAPPAKTKG